MNREEFEYYLESIGGLISGYYPDKPPIKNSYFFEVNEGWYDIIKNLIEELIAAGWDKQICQAKEKFGCYDEETEVLTKSGWKFFNDCTFDDEIATLVDDGYMVYNKPSDIIKYHYKGDMYKLESRGVNLLVTPNHNLYISKGGWIGRYDKYNVNKHEYQFCTPDKFFRKQKRFKKSFRWRGKEIKSINIDGYSYSNLHRNGEIRNYNKQSQEYDIKEFLKFLGFYTAEGCADEDKGDIRIAACNDGSLKAVNEQKDFEKVLYDNKFYIKKSMENRSAITYNLYNKVLAKWLVKEVGKGALNKKVPTFIKDLTPELIEIYLTWLFKGDGHKSNTAHTLYTSSKSLADDVCELILKCGQTFSFEELPIRISNLVCSENIPYSIRWLKNSNDFEISNKTIKNTKSFIEEFVKYDGFVYCLTVPGNKLFVRRNGKGVWCGNSLRFYTNSMSDECHKIVYKYEKLSMETCEVCGNKGEQRPGGWIQTLCIKHYIEPIFNKFETNSKYGFTNSEIEELLKKFPEINMDKFNDAMFGNTCMVIDGETIKYHHDVRSALYCGIENRDQRIDEWD